MPTPKFVERLQRLKDEYEQARDKSFYSSWDDFLFSRLCTIEEQMELLATEIVEVGKCAGIVDGTQPLTGPQILLVLSDLKSALGKVA